MRVGDVRITQKLEENPFIELVLSSTQRAYGCNSLSSTLSPRSLLFLEEVSEMELNTRGPQKLKLNSINGVVSTLKISSVRILHHYSNLREQKFLDLMAYEATKKIPTE